jgi:hypothetical protein
MTRRSPLYPSNHTVTTVDMITGGCLYVVIDFENSR